MNLFDTTTISEQAKEKYRNSGNIKDKWLREYKKISMEGDYQKNRACLLEVFNMLDYVMQNHLEAEMQYHSRLQDQEWQGKIQYCFLIEDENREVRFYPPTTFKSRVFALNRFGYQISEEIDDQMRLVRNITAHGVETVIRDHMQLDYEYTKSLMHMMGSAFVNLGVLDDSLVEPSFDLLRVKENEVLQSGAYIIDAFKAEGGSGRVYKGRQIKLNRTVAIKELKSGAYDREQMAKECRILVHLRHNQIPQIIDVFSENGTFYIVMEYIEGINLQQYVNKYNVEDSDIIQLGIQLCDLIGYLHRQGIIYSDIKPQNILINQYGQLRLIDFGVARRMTQHTAIGYSTAYAAPEVILSGRGDQRADFYSMGILLQELCFSSIEDPSIRPGLQSVIQKCLMRNPQERYQNAAELKQALELITDTSEPSLEKKDPSREKSNKRLIISLGTIASITIVVLSIIFILMLQNTKQLNDKLETVMMSYSQSDGSSNDGFGVSAKSIGSGESQIKTSSEEKKENTSDEETNQIKALIERISKNASEEDTKEPNQNVGTDYVAKREDGFINGDSYIAEYYVSNQSGYGWENAELFVTEEWTLDDGSIKSIYFRMKIETLPNNSNCTVRGRLDLAKNNLNLKKFKSYSIIALENN